MDVKHVGGKNKGKVFVYALSTCGWCRKTKAFLNENGIAFSYVDVDLETGAEREKVLNEVRKWNPNSSFPTVVLNDATCLVGFQPDKMKETLKI